MELWFILAVTTIFFAGIDSFTHKIAAENKYDISVLSIYSSSLAVTVLFGCLIFFSDFSHFWELSVAMAFVGSSTYFLTLILKVESLKLIDSAIFFPVYKILGPLFAIIIGVLAFAESFTLTEWIGLGLSLTVPLLLITKAENRRQKNLFRGLYILSIAAVIGSASIAFHKYGVDISNNVWLYILVSEFVRLLTATTVLLKKNKRNLYRSFRDSSTYPVLRLGFFMGIIQVLGTIAMIFAFATGGPLGIVYTISSIYILIPIILSIIVYKEHWNFRKAFAIVVSIAALALLK